MKIKGISDENWKEKVTIVNANFCLRQMSWFLVVTKAGLHTIYGFFNDHSTTIINYLDINPMRTVRFAKFHKTVTRMGGTNSRRVLHTVKSNRTSSVS